MEAIETYSFKTEDTAEFNTYKIMKKKKYSETASEVDSEKEYFTVTFNKDLHQVIIYTPKEAYMGPVEFIRFSADIASKKDSNFLPKKDFRDELILRIVTTALNCFMCTNESDNKTYLTDVNNTVTVPLSLEELNYIYNLINNNKSLAKKFN